MRKLIVDYLNTLISSLGDFTNRINIATIQPIQIGEDSGSAPVYYTSGGDSLAIDFDFNEATIYHRILSISRTQEDADTGCGTNITENSSMRLVAFFPKNILKTDNSSIEEKIAQNISNLIGASNIRGLATSLQVDYVNVSVNDIDLNKVDVFSGEFSGFPFTVPSDYCLIAIDYSIEISGDQSCFLNYGCNDTEIDINDLINNTICSKVRIENEAGDLLAYVTPGETYICAGGEGTVMKSYISTASTTQSFPDFIGIANITVLIQSAGIMGHLVGLDAAHKLLTNWNSATGVATFKSTLPAGNQILVMETSN